MARTTQGAQAHKQQNKNNFLPIRNQKERMAETATTVQGDQPASPTLRSQVLSLNEQNIH